MGGQHLLEDVRLGFEDVSAIKLGLNEVGGRLPIQAGNVLFCELEMTVVMAERAEEVVIPMRLMRRH